MVEFGLRWRRLTRNREGGNECRVKFGVKYLRVRVSMCMSLFALMLAHSMCILCLLAVLVPKWFPSDFGTGTYDRRSDHAMSHAGRRRDRILRGTRYWVGLTSLPSSSFEVHPPSSAFTVTVDLLRRSGLLGSIMIPNEGLERKWFHP